MSTTFALKESGAGVFPSLLNAGAGLWHKSAPASVADADDWTNGSDGWSAWKRHLARRSKPRPISRLLVHKRPVLNWALSECGAGEATATLISRLDAVARTVDQPPQRRRSEDWTSPVRHWLADAEAARHDVAFGLESLAWCYALPALAPRLRAVEWWEMLSELIDVAVAVAAGDRDAPPLASQLLGGELPLALAYQFPELEPCRPLVNTSRRVLSDSLVEYLDGEGLPHAGRLDLLRPLLACWTRCRALGAHWKKGCWSDAAETQFQWLVRQALRTTRYDGRQIFANAETGAWCRDLFTAALRYGGDADDQRIASCAFPGAKKEARRMRKLPPAAENSEWAEVAVLRRSWARATDLLAVCYHDCKVRTELVTGRDVVWSGEWGVELHRDDRKIDQTSPWNEVCWLDVDEAIYLELEASFESGVKVQRQMLLGREDGFLYLADAVLGTRAMEIDYQSSLPLAPGVEFTPADETREGWLCTRHRKLLAMPLALPEWRSDMRPGRLEVADGRLSLSAQSQGRALYAPLWISLNSHGRSKPFTWRQLTVAENRVIQNRDIAVGYRVQVGKQQWLFYRALASLGNRTVLGQNLSNEFTAGRFDRDGQVDALVEIE